jgi:hypothetical protein
MEQNSQDSFEFNSEESAPRPNSEAPDSFQFKSESQADLPIGDNDGDLEIGEVNEGDAISF